jgi:hypothetical protein
MAITDFDGQYTGLGIMQGGGMQDSGAVVKSATPATVAVTWPTVGGVQPTIQRGKYCVSLTAANGAAVFGGLDIYATDGTNTEYLDTKAASRGAVAGQAATFMAEFFSALINITNIVTLTASIATSGNNNYTMRLRVGGGM